MYKILVTGVGAIIGYGIIRSLRASQYPVKIIGMDIYEDAVGQNWCDAFEKSVPTVDPKYMDFLRSIILKHSIDLVIPGIEQDITRLARDSSWLNDLNVRVVLNNPELILTAEDKWLTHLKLIESGFSTIKTYSEGSYPDLLKILGTPMLLKPRKSYASKGIYKIDDEEDFLYWKKKLGNNFMVQEIVGDNESEYTVGVFGFGDGTGSNKIIFQRKLSVEGATAKAKVVAISELEFFVDQLVALFKPVGPTNFQFRYHDSKFLLLEINPRISSSTSIRTAFGYNEAEMCIEYYIEGEKPRKREIIGGTAIRFIEDLVKYNNRE